MYWYSFNRSYRRAQLRMDQDVVINTTELEGPVD
jgi:hypothetical protein